MLRSPRVLGAASLAAIRLDPKNVQAYTGRAISYQKKGDIARAKVDYEKAPSLDPDAETRKDVQAALDALGHDRRRIFRRS
ncbi:MAG: tetratricopeptide repeat protein [Methyloceanibacter sp.]